MGIIEREQAEERWRKALMAAGFRPLEDTYEYKRSRVLAHPPGSAANLVPDTSDRHRKGES